MKFVLPMNLLHKLTPICLGVFAFLSSSLSIAHAQDKEAQPPPFRTLYSNDTTNIASSPSPFKTKKSNITEADIRASVDETAGGGVDVHMLQPGLGWVPWWKSSVLPMADHLDWVKRTGRTPSSFEKFVLGGGDIVQIFVDECRAKGIAPFISLRVNDTHNVSRGMPIKDLAARRKAMTEFKLYDDHPEWLIGPGSDEEERTQYAFDFSRKEIQDYKLALIRELAGYDIDGLELDLMRHWRFFHQGRTTSAERERMMTGFIKQVRAILDETAKPGQHRWLAVRLPGYTEAHDAMGLNVKNLTEVAGVDILNLSGHYFTDLQLEIKKIRAQVPAHVGVYTELHFTNAAIPPTDTQSKFFRRSSPQSFYTAAHLAYARGAAGISTFNFQYYRGTWNKDDVSGHPAEPPFFVFPHLKDPKWLAQQPQQYVVGYLWNSPIKPGRPLYGRFTPESQLKKITLDMAPPAGGWKSGGRMRIQATRSLGDSQWAATLNGVRLKSIEDVSEPYRNEAKDLGQPEDYRAFAVPAEILKDGENEIQLTMLSGKEPVQLFYLDINVK